MDSFFFSLFCCARCFFFDAHQALVQVVVREVVREVVRAVVLEVVAAVGLAVDQAAGQAPAPAPAPALDRVAKVTVVKRWVGVFACGAILAPPPRVCVYVFSFAGGGNHYFVLVAVSYFFFFFFLRYRNRRLRSRRVMERRRLQRRRRKMTPPRKLKINPKIKRRRRDAVWFHKEVLRHCQSVNPNNQYFCVIACSALVNDF